MFLIYQNKQIRKPTLSLYLLATLPTPDAIVCAQLMPMLSLFHELTLGSDTGVFWWRDRKYGTIFLPHCET